MTMSLKMQKLTLETFYPPIQFRCNNVNMSKCCEHICIQKSFVPWTCDNNGWAQNQLMDIQLKDLLKLKLL